MAWDLLRGPEIAKALNNHHNERIKRKYQELILSLETLMQLVQNEGDSLPDPHTSDLELIKEKLQKKIATIFNDWRLPESIRFDTRFDILASCLIELIEVLQRIENDR